VSDSRTFAVVGAGLAGAKAVEAIRAEGFDGSVVLFGAEQYRPYERPPLSKGYLQGADERDTVFVHAPTWYAEHDVDLRLDVPVVGLDRQAHELTTRDGDTLR
jgi:3-phenylpropionate/trans-cinnamate dioxygenase ferredoxin reductase component